MQARSMVRYALLVLAASVMAQAATVTLRTVAEDAGASYKVKTRIEGAWAAGTMVEIQLDSDGADQSHVLQMSALRSQFVRRDTDRDTVLATVNRVPTDISPLDVLVSRDDWRMNLIVAGEVWLTACDESFDKHEVAIGSSDTDIKFVDPTVQPTEAIWFEDDFMRDTAQHGDWQVRRGTWSPSGVSEDDAKPEKRPEASKSSNPFAYRVRQPEGGGVATAGQWYWDNYRFNTSVRATGEGTIGLLAYVQPEKESWLAFEWDYGAEGTERRLVAVQDGRRTVLSSAPGGWADDQWYRIGLEVIDGQLTAFIDGLPVLSARSDLYGQGAVGLFGNGVRWADYDDVTVQSDVELRDEFMTDSAGRWRALKGTFATNPAGRCPRLAGETLPSAGLGVMEVKSGPLLAVSGARAWGDYKVSAVGRANGAGRFGVIACEQDEKNYWGMECGGNVVNIFRVRGGTRRDMPFTTMLTAGTAHSVAIEVRDDLLKFWLDGVPCSSTLDVEMHTGRVGLIASGSDVVFDRASVQTMVSDPPVEFTEQFTHEDTMAGWASPEGSWYADEVSQRGGVLWHRGLFYNDSEMTLDGSQFGGSPRTARMILCGDGLNAASGFALTVVQPKSGDRGVVLDLAVNGQSVRRTSETDLVQLPADKTVRFAVHGYVLTGSVGDKCVVAHDLSLGGANAARGNCAGVLARGFEVDLAKIDARSLNRYDTTFVKAPWEWQSGKGLWETVNRWKCDPRWSFFGGYKNPNPLMWTKADYFGDQQVEAYMAIKMDMPGPPYYLHPSNLGVTLGGNGRDVLSGVTLLFAARNNTCSLLYRDGILVGENKDPGAKFAHVGPQGEGLTKFHRHWFHLVLRRVGGKIQAFCDDKLLFDVPDTGPTTARPGKVGIFGVDNGVMVSRVKLWYQAQMPVPTAFPDLAALHASADPGSTSGDPFANDFEGGIGHFTQESTDAPVLLTRASENVVSGRSCLKAINLSTGGTFGVNAVSQPFTLADRPRLRFRFCAPRGTRTNLYFYTRDNCYALPLTGGDEHDKDIKALRKVPGIVANGLWQVVNVDLPSLLQAAGVSPTTSIERVAFGCTRGLARTCSGRPGIWMIGIWGASPPARPGSAR
ncbi:MAG: hypothetical protein HZB16_00885 [Armatimonadetes bacterium]|nr:hypothetical protein [Armatimonadota bacterium]